ncbi:MAG: hypothetical protein C5B52_00950 [Bacteroidetes bacterium]|nr:MAG: hypothetical protein C5B52_00950 [Bacteroidota bacterium]
MKKLIRNFLGYFGYDIVKVMPTNVLKKQRKVRVGKFTIIMPGNNPLAYTYTKQPDFGSEISRLVGYVKTKYPDMGFLDIGANTGDTIAHVKSVSDVPVIAIEGDDVSYKYLTENVKQFNGVTIIKQFVGESDSEMNISLEKAGWNTTLIPDSGTGKQIQIKKVDTVFKEKNIDPSKIKIFKIDAEGFDTIIIRGALEYIASAKPVIFLEYNRDNMLAIHENGLDTILQLQEKGYNKILFFDDQGRFLLSTTLSDKHLIHEMHSYADGKSGLIYYYNLCLFHSSDDDLAALTVKGELEYKSAFSINQ